ncbi:MAG: TonB-dependent receptor family protein [Saprospiraceae bacterium]|nr:TonB-dependent receptor family protein [Saprospiraceae bacterium]
MNSEITSFISLLFLLVSGPTFLLAQQTANGVIKDDQDQAVLYANVMAINLIDSSLATGSVSDESGNFQLRIPNDFQGIIKVSAIGYQEQSKTWDEGLSNYNFKLAPAAELLDEVVVTSRKVLFEQKPDRLIVNVQSSIMSKGGNVLDVLEKSPGIGLDRQNGNISLNGKAGVGVMINGKLTRLPPAAVVQMLSGMSADNVDNIELITNPPAKYEASGSALINIVLLENEYEGLNGNYGVTAKYNHDIGYGLNFNLNHRKGKWNSFVTYNGSLDQWKGVWYQHNVLEEGSGTLVNESSILRISSQENHALRVGTGYTLSENTELSLTLSGYANMWATDDFNHGFLQPGLDSMVSFSGIIDETNLWKNGLVSLGLDHAFSKKSQLAIYLDYLKYDNDQPAKFDNDYRDETQELILEELLETSKVTPIDIWVSKLDYSSQLNDDWRVEAGAKLSQSLFENIFEVQRTVDQTVEILSDLSSRAKLDERIYAGYFSADWTANNRWRYTAGLRYEHTSTELGTPGETLLVDRKYGNFFPSLTANYKISERSNLSLAYGRRITRPNFNDLAPFTYFQNPQTLISGNANLRPAITDNLELNYQPGQWWLSLSYSYIKDQIVWFQPEIDDRTGLQLIRAQNLDYYKTYGIQVNAPLPFSSWLETQNTFSFQRIEMNPKGNDQSDIFTNYNFTYQGTATIILPKNFTSEINMNYQSAPSWWGVSDLSSLFQVNFALKKKLGKSGGDLSFVFTDVFDTYQWKWQNAEGSITDFAFNGFYKRGIQGVRISYTNNFGNRKLKKVMIGTGSSEEQRRVQ